MLCGPKVHRIVVMSPEVRLMAAIVACVGLLLTIVAFLTGWALGSRRATAERLTWHYVICAAFIGLRKCLDEKREDIRDYMTAEAQIHYRLWRKGTRGEAKPFSPHTDQFFTIAAREFASEI